MSPASGDFAGFVVASQYRGFVVCAHAAWLFVVKSVVVKAIFGMWNDDALPGRRPVGAGIVSVVIDADGV